MGTACVARPFTPLLVVSLFLFALCNVVLSGLSSDTKHTFLIMTKKVMNHGKGKYCNPRCSKSGMCANLPYPTPVLFPTKKLVGERGARKLGQSFCQIWFLGKLP